MSAPPPTPQRTDPINTHQNVNPPSLSFPSAKVASPVGQITKDRITINSIDATYSPTGNNKVRFLLPRDGSVHDFQRAHWEADVTVTQPAPGTACFENGSHSMIKTARIRCPDELEIMRDYNRYVSFMREHGTKIGATVQDFRIRGFGSDADRQSWADAGTTHYHFGIYLGMLKNQVFPTRYINQDIYVEFELEDVVRCMQGTTAVGVSYTLTNCVLRCDSIRGEAYHNYLGQTIRSGGLNFGYQGYETFLTAPFNTTQFSYSVPSRVNAVEGFFVLLQPETYATTITNLEKLLTSGRYNLQTYQMKREGTMWPTQPIEVTNGQAYTEYLRAFNNYHCTGAWKDGALINFSVFQGNTRFVVFFEVNANANDGLISRKGTVGYNVDTVLTLNFNPVPGANTVAWVLVPSYVSVFLGRDGRFALAK